MYRLIAKGYQMHGTLMYLTKCIHCKLHDDVMKWKHFPRYWPFVRGIHRWPVNSPHKGQWRGASAFSVICTWINGWVNNGEAGDLRRYRAIYDVTVMWACAISKQGLPNIHVVTTHLPVVMSNNMGKTRFKKLMTLFWLSFLVIFGDITDGVSYLLCSLDFSGLASSSVSVLFPTMLCQWATCIAAFGIPWHWCRVNVMASHTTGQLGVCSTVSSC